MDYHGSVSQSLKRFVMMPNSVSSKIPRLPTSNLSTNDVEARPVLISPDPQKRQALAEIFKKTIQDVGLPHILKCYGDTSYIAFGGSSTNDSTRKS